MLQAEFAKRMGVSQATVSDWERGRKEPSIDSYNKLARLCPDDAEAKWFVQRYLKLTGMDQIAASYRNKAKIEQFRTSEVNEDVVRVPMLKDAAAAGTPRAIDEKEIEKHLAIPQEWVGRRSTITAIKVVGDSMSPILEEGYIVLVDTNDRDPKRLINQMVAARDEDGVTIKWLRRGDRKDVFLLVPQHTSVRHPVRLLVEGSAEVEVVGRVLKWIGEPPPPRR